MSDFNLSAFSDAVADVAATAASSTASFATHHHRTASAFHWRDGFFVTSEEAVEAGEEIELTLASGETVKAELVGRDPSTGVALLKPASAVSSAPLGKAGVVRPGNIAIAVGASEGSGLAVSGFAQWIANAAISVSFPALAVSPGLAITYTGYALCAAISFFFVRRMVSETRGRELEDMEG